MRFYFFSVSPERDTVFADLKRAEGYEAHSSTFSTFLKADQIRPAADTVFRCNVATTVGPAASTGSLGRKVISARLAEILMSHPGVPELIQLLPVTVVNRKNQPLREEYFLLSVPGMAELFDLERSEYLRIPRGPRIRNQPELRYREFYIASFSRAVPLDGYARAAHLPITRQLYCPFTAFFREDLAERVRAANFAKIRLADPLEEEDVRIFN